MQLVRAFVVLALSTSVSIAAMPIGGASATSLLSKRMFPSVLGRHGCEACEKESIRGVIIAPEHHQAVHPANLARLEPLVVPYPSHGGIPAPEMRPDEARYVQNHESTQALDGGYQQAMRYLRDIYGRRRGQEDYDFELARDFHARIHRSLAGYAEKNRRDADKTVARVDHNLAVAPHDPRKTEWLQDKQEALDSMKGHEELAELHKQRASELSEAKFPDGKAFFAQHGYKYQ